MTSERRWRRLLGLLLVLALAPLTVLATAAPSQADPTALISGTVSDEAGAGINGVNVYVEAWSDADGAWEPAPVAFTTAAADGAYEIAGLDAGRYRVFYVDGSNDHLGGYWHDGSPVADAYADDATPIDLGPGDQVTINAQLRTAGHITGTVTGPDSALEGIEVSAYIRDFEGSLTFIAQAETDADGHYDVNGLIGNTYYLEFADPLGRGYITLGADDVDPVVVDPGATVAGVDAALALGGTIGGTVTDPAGDPLDHVYVQLTRLTVPGSSGFPDQDYVDHTYTAADGSYAFVGLRDDTYAVAFQDFTGTYTQQYYDSTYDFLNPTPVVIAGAAHRTDVDATMQTYSGISGRVVDQGGTGLGSIGVTLYRYEYDHWEAQYTIDTGASGAYDLTNLRPGDYRLRFDDYDADHYLSRWWQDADAEEDARTITVPPGQTVALDDETLRVAGHIAGAVTDGDGAGLEGITVVVRRAAPPTFPTVRETTTGADGAFDLSGLAAGEYVVGLQDDSGTYVDEFWEDGATLEDATPLEVTDGQTTTIEPVLDAAGTIAGTVADADLAAVRNVTVKAYRWDAGTSAWAQVATDTTDSAGQYEFRGLAAGDYTLEYDGRALGYLREYWDDRATLDQADHLTIATGQAVTDADARLQQAGRVRGTVTDSVSHTAVANVDVELYAAGEDTPYATVRTDSSGRYDVGSLPFGDYRVELSDRGAQRHVATSRDVTLSAAAPTAQTDVALVPGGSIAGSVVESWDDYPIQNIRVTLYGGSGDDWDEVDSVVTDVNGEFTFTGLPVGSYKLRYADTTSDGFLPEWFRDKDSLANALAVDIEAPGATVGLGGPEVMDLGGVINGKVTGTDVGKLAEAVVRLYRLDGDDWVYVDSRLTSSEGDYEFRALAPGSYRVKFSTDAAHDFLDQWYGETLQVRLNDTLMQIDAQLDLAVAVSGRVTDVAGVPLDGYAVELWTYDNHGTYTQVDSTTTDGDGGYEFGQLPAGTYLVRVDGGDDYLDEWWDDAPTREEATVVEAVSGDTLDRDIVLAHQGHITGTVTGPDAAPLEDVTVTAYRWKTVASAWVVAGDTSTDSEGDYDIGGLPHGTYVLRFVDDSGAGLDTEYWNDKRTLGQAVSFPLADEQTQAGLDARLTRTILSTTEPQVTGDPLVDSTLEATSGEWDLDPVDVAYQWLRDGEEIDGADDSSYTLTIDDLGADISVEVTASRLGYRDGVQTSDAVGPIGRPAVANTGLPTISGTPRLGSPLSASTGAWTPATGVTLAYQWFAGDDPIASATGATYTPGVADVGRTIRVRVTASRENWTGAAATSAATAVVQPGDLAVSTAPAISGTAQVGSTLSVSPGTWSPAPDTVTYQWRADGAPIAGATGTSYTPVASDAGKQLTVVVTAAKAGHTSASATTSPVTVAPVAVTPGSITATRKPKLSGKVKRGGKLVVDPGAWAPSGAKVTVQWYAGKKAIRKATSTTLKLSGKTLKAVTRKAISVRVIVTAPGYPAVTTTLKAKGKIKRWTPRR